MKVTLKLWAYFRDYLPHKDRTKLETIRDVAPGMTVEALLRDVGLPLDDCRLVTVNGILYVDRTLWADIVLTDGDAVGVLPNVH